jgi:hypothetical protein
MKADYHKNKVAPLLVDGGWSGVSWKELCSVPGDKLVSVCPEGFGSGLRCPNL